MMWVGMSGFAPSIHAWPTSWVVSVAAQKYAGLSFQPICSPPLGGRMTNQRGLAAALLFNDHSPIAVGKVNLGEQYDVLLGGNSYMNRILVEV
jgi:hypothetical protein